MPTITDTTPERKPGAGFTVVVLLAVLVLYPLVGAGLAMLATGVRQLDIDTIAMQPPLLSKLLAAQAVGQILALAIPALLLGWRFSGGPSPFGRPARAWLGLVAPDDWRPVLAAVVGMVLLQPLMYTISGLQDLLLPLLGEAGKAVLRDQERLERFIAKIATADSPAGFLWVASVLAVTPAFCEEVFFRGYVQKSFRTTLSARGALPLTAFVFALFHLEPSNLIPLTLLGWYIGYIYESSGSLAVPAAAHATNNLVALLFLHLDVRFMGISLAGSGAGAVCMWQWWVVVAVCAVLFILLIRRFDNTAVSA